MSQDSDNFTASRSQNEVADRALTRSQNLLRSGKKFRVVVKVGSSSLTQAGGALDSSRIRFFSSHLAHCARGGAETVLVSSGAVAAGCGAMRINRRPQSLALRQAMAAIGQGLLMEAYNEAFRAEHLHVAQVLLNRGDFAIRQSYNNALAALEELLTLKVVPIVNENDTVAWKRETFGDNDMLAALVAALLRATMLVIVTDIDGLYSADPRTSSEATRINEVDVIDESIINLAGGAGSHVGTGGMLSKVLAARHATRLGIPVFIGSLSEQGSLFEIVDGKGDGTYFHAPESDSLGRKRQWIAFHSESEGDIIVDEGAARALLDSGRSLLPVGISEIYGSFPAGSVVSVLDQRRVIIGKGIVNYSAEELGQLKGFSTTAARAITRRARDEVIHRDDWVEL